MLKLGICGAAKGTDVKVQVRRSKGTSFEFASGSCQMSAVGRSDYGVLNWYRLIPSFVIFDSSVCLGIPNLAAAPVEPEMRPWHSCSAVSIIAFSRSTRFAINGVLISQGAGVCLFSQDLSTEKASPSHKITARSITFCSSRILPGQS